MTSPDVDYAHTTGADRARSSKAAHLAAAAAAAGLSADDVTRLDADGRKALVKAAGTRQGSGETWRLVATLLARQGVGTAPRGVDVFG